MSAICGIFNPDGAPADPGLLRNIAMAAAHRGPDGIHYWIKDNVGLAHLALHTTPESIHEHQPLVDARGEVVLTADARLDNRDELIQILSAKGFLHSARPTDADLILATYACWEQACPERLIGEFAFVIWDSPRRRLFAARDQSGVRMLYYRSPPHTFQWATEAAMLLADPAYPVRLNEVMVAQDLAMVGFGGRNESYYQDISKLGPAERLLVDQDGIHQQSYWDFNPRNTIRYRSDQEYVDHFASLFRRTVRDRLRSHLPIGLFMSGGIDSTSIAAAAADEMRQNPSSLTPGLHAVHWTVKDPQLVQYDESMRCKPVAERWGIPYQEIDVQPYGQLYDYPEKAPHRDEPFRSQLYGWYDASFAALSGPEAPRLWLTGHVGDILVGGFNSYYYLNLLKTARLKTLHQEMSHHRDLYHFSYRQLLGFILPPLLLQPLLQHYRRWIRRKQIRVPAYIPSDLARRTGLSEWMYRQTYDWKNQASSWSDHAKRMRFHWINYSPDLRARTWFDRLAAAWNAEISTPWDDIRLKEFILAIPEEQICQGVNHKLILRRAMHDLLPEATRERRGLRVGMPLYIAKALLAPEAELKINALLANSRAGKAGFIELNAFRCAIQDYLGGKKPYSLKLWSALSLETWLRAYDFQD